MADRFVVDDGQVSWKGKKLGDGLIADFNELKTVAERDGVIHMETPNRIDMLFAAGDKVAGVESKTPSDLVTSFNSRRLARQFAMLLEVVDVPVLMVRGVWPEEVMTYEAAPMASIGGEQQKRRPVWWHHDAPPFFTHRSRKSLRELWVELARWQMLGGLVVHGPGPDHLVPQFVDALKPVVAGNTLARALAGSDYRKRRDASDEWAMLKSVPGIGEATIAKLRKMFTTPGEAIRSFFADQWSGIKVSDRVKGNMATSLGEPRVEKVTAIITRETLFGQAATRHDEPQYLEGCTAQPTTLPEEFFEDQALAASLKQDYGN